MNINKLPYPELITLTRVLGLNDVIPLAKTFWRKGKNYLPYQAKARVILKRNIRKKLKEVKNGLRSKGKNSHVLF